MGPLKAPHARPNGLDRQSDEAAGPVADPRGVKQVHLTADEAEKIVEDLIAERDVALEDLGEFPHCPPELLERFVREKPGDARSAFKAFRKALVEAWNAKVVAAQVQARELRNRHERAIGRW